MKLSNELEHKGIYLRNNVRLQGTPFCKCGLGLAQPDTLNTMSVGHEAEMVISRLAWAGHLQLLLLLFFLKKGSWLVYYCIVWIFIIIIINNNNKTKLMI